MRSGAGRDREVEAFIVANAPGLMRSAVVLTGNGTDAQDLVQRTCLALWRSWGKVASAADPVAYAHKVLINDHLSERRRRHWHREQPTEKLPEPSHTDVNRFEDSARLRTVLATLPPGQRAAIVLRFIADFDDDRIAAALGCSVATVRSQISRGLVKLRPAYAEEIRHDR